MNSELETLKTEVERLQRERDAFIKYFDDEEQHQTFGHLIKENVRLQAALEAMESRLNFACERLEVRETELDKLQAELEVSKKEVIKFSNADTTSGLLLSEARVELAKAKQYDLTTAVLAKDVKVYEEIEQARADLAEALDRIKITNETNRLKQMTINELLSNGDLAGHLLDKERAKAKKLVGALEGLKITDCCWCDIAIGDPRVTDHTSRCKSASEALAAYEHEPDLPVAGNPSESEIAGER